MNKLIDIDSLARRSRELKAAGKVLVATNGCFDLLHAGHVRYLQKARALGDALVVGLNGDDSVGTLKGPGRPVNNAHDRADVISALACVDFVTIFPETQATRFLEAASPTIYVKGGDYTADALDPDERKILETVGAKIQIIPFEQGYSTSSLIARLRDCSK